MVSLKAFAGLAIILMMAPFEGPEAAAVLAMPSDAEVDEAAALKTSIE